jgi:transposase-like protein
MMIETKFTKDEIIWIKRFKKNNKLSFFGKKIYRHNSHNAYTSKAYTASSTFLSLLNRKVLIKRNGFIEVAEGY